MFKESKKKRFYEAYAIEKLDSDDAMTCVASVWSVPINIIKCLTLGQEIHVPADNFCGVAQCELNWELISDRRYAIEVWNISSYIILDAQ